MEDYWARRAQEERDFEKLCSTFGYTVIGVVACVGATVLLIIACYLT